MATYLELAKLGVPFPELESVASMEEVDPASLMESVSTGRVVIVPSRGKKVVALGHGVRTKVLCNFGTSSSSPDVEAEIEKARIAVDNGAAIICDQSVGDCVAANRARIVGALDVPIAAVPLYQNADEARTANGDPLSFDAESVVKVFIQQVRDGVTMPGFHTMTAELAAGLKGSDRLMPVVSRGAGILMEWIRRTGKENPYLDRFDDILDCCRDMNVPLTLISSVRSGTVVDGFDKWQTAEWKIMHNLVRRAWEAGVSMLADGLGHMSIDEIGPAVKGFKTTCGDIPLGVLGPTTTDRGLGHEHVVNAIGTATAVMNGANYVNACYRTEHLGLPQIDDISEGIRTAYIAVHCGDLGRSDLKGRLMLEERKISTARAKAQWGLQLQAALDPVMARTTFARVGAKNKEGEGCSICGDLCPFVTTGQVNHGGK